MQVLCFLGLGFAMSFVSQWVFWASMFPQDQVGRSGRFIVWLLLWLPVSLWFAWSVCEARLS